MNKATRIAQMLTLGGLAGARGAVPFGPPDGEPVVCVPGPPLEGMLTRFGPQLAGR